MFLVLLHVRYKCSVMCGPFKGKLKKLSETLNIYTQKFIFIIFLATYSTEKQTCSIFYSFHYMICDILCLITVKI